MLLTILLLSLILSSLANARADAETSPKQGSEGLEKLIEKLEFRLRDMETRFQDEKEKLELRLEEMEMRMKYKDAEKANEKKELEAKNRDLETRLEELEDKIKEEKEKGQMGLKESTSKLRIEVEKESSGKEMASNISNNAVTKPSLRDLPIVLISAWRDSVITSPQTVTYGSFLANFNNANRPGGGDGVLDLDSGVFTCFTPGYYTVSFSAYADLGGSAKRHLYLYKNGSQLPESYWFVGTNNNDVDATNFGAVSSRIMILHLDEGDALELRMTDGNYISKITLNIELIGLGFDYIV